MFPKPDDFKKTHIVNGWAVSCPDCGYFGADNHPEALVDHMIMQHGYTLISQENAGEVGDDVLNSGIKYTLGKDPKYPTGSRRLPRRIAHPRR